MAYPQPKTSLKQRTTFNPDAGMAAAIEDAYRAANETFEILDIGCGHGHYHQDMKETLEQLGEAEVRITGLDKNSESLKNGDVEGAAYDFSWGHIPFKDDSFDMVYNSHLLCQLDDEDIEAVRSEAERILKDSGIKYTEHKPL